MASVTDSYGGKGASDIAAPDLTELRRWVEGFTTATKDSRADSATSIDYYDGKQLSSAVRAALRKRKQPDIVTNRVKVAINGILGVTQRGKSDPRAYPRNPQDEGAADVATDALRYASEKARFTATKLSVFKDILVPGTGAALVGVDDDKNITIEQIRWEEFIYDPRSRREDFADASWMGIAKWMFVDDAALMWPAQKAQLMQVCSQWSGIGGSPDLTMRDRPETMGWVDQRQRRLMVVECYYRLAGKWVRSVFTGNISLEHGPSPYLDERKRPICPIEAQSAYVDQTNQRYGPVRDMRGPQDEINARRSKGLHWLNVRQIQEASPGSGMGSIEDARKEAARPDGVLPSGWVVVPGSAQQVSGNLEMLQEAKAEIERLSPNPAILGRDGTDASGRAVLARQQAGLVELALLYGGLEDWELRVFRQVWARMKQFWTAPMWVRVTDDEGAPQFVGINQPRGAPMVHPPVDDQGQPHPMAGQPVVDGQGQPQEAEPQLHGPVMQDQFSGQPVPNPQHGQPVLGYKNQVGEMDVDIILDTTPDTANLQQEQFTELMQLVGASPLYQQQVPLTTLIKLSSIPHKKDVLDQLEQTAQAGQQQQQQQAQFNQQKQEADLAETASKIELNKANAAKSQVEAETKGAGGLLDALQAGMADAQHAPHQHNTNSQPEPEEAEA